MKASRSGPPPETFTTASTPEGGYEWLRRCAIRSFLSLTLLTAALVAARLGGRGDEHSVTAAAPAAQASVPSLEPAKTETLWRSLVTAPRVRESRAQAVCRPLRAVFYAASDWLRLATKSRDQVALRGVLRLGSTARRGQDAVPARPGLAHPSPRAQLPRACGDPLRELDALGREHG